MPGVFICYRREDTGGEAGRVYDRLSTHFGSERVFRDVDTIRPGDLFPRAIGDRLSRCNVVLALIGPRWLRAGGEATESRLDDPDDFVRIELATAIRRRIPVIPALFRNARMPQAAELPSDLAPLASCQAIQIHDADFHADVTRLIAVLEPMVPPADDSAPAPHGGIPWVRTAVLIASAAALIVLGSQALDRVRERPASEADGVSASTTLRAEPATLSAEEVRAIILRNDFFSPRINPAGAGTGSTYTVEVIGDAAVVVDETSGLMWEQGGSGSPVSGGLAGAFEYVADLNREAEGGFRNWRLPTLEEALALLTSDGQPDFHLPPRFDAIGAPFIWTADAHPTGGGWIVYYADGIAAREPPAFNGYVRAVRGLD